jgi:hypothetical protein
MYKVIKDFTDLQDKNHVYLAGDEFPRKGTKVDNARILELSTDANKRGEILIEMVQSREPQEEAEEIPKEAEEVVEEPKAQSTEEKPKKAKKKK